MTVSTSASSTQRQIRSNRNKMIGVVVILVLLAIWQNDFLYKGIKANFYVNGTIIGAFLFAIVAAFLMVVRLNNEVLALNALQEMWSDIRRSENGEGDLSDPVLRQRLTRPAIFFDRPRILGHAYDLVTDELARTKRIKISLETMQALVHKIEASIAEERSLINYMSGLLVFMGLIGTFMGLLKMVGSIGAILGSLQATGGGGANTAFQKLLTDLQQPLAGMTTGFASSLFGLLGSLIVGLLARYAGNAASALKAEFESWLATVVKINEDHETDAIKRGYLVAQQVDPALSAMVDKLVTDYHAARTGFERAEIAINAMLEAQQRHAEVVAGLFGQMTTLNHHQAATAQTLQEFKSAVPNTQVLATALDGLGREIDRRMVQYGAAQGRQIAALGERHEAVLSAVAEQQQLMGSQLAESLVQHRESMALVQNQIASFVSEANGLKTTERETMRGVLAHHEAVALGLKASIDRLPEKLVQAQARATQEQNQSFAGTLAKVMVESREVLNRQHGEQEKSLSEARVALDEAIQELADVKSNLRRAATTHRAFDLADGDAGSGQHMTRRLSTLRGALSHVLGRSGSSPGDEFSKHTDQVSAERNQRSGTDRI